jgi:hypothetical protein
MAPFPFLERIGRKPYEAGRAAVRRPQQRADLNLAGARLPVHLQGSGAERPIAGLPVCRFTAPARFPSAWPRTSARLKRNLYHTVVLLSFGPRRSRIQPPVAIAEAGINAICSAAWVFTPSCSSRWRP